MVVPLGFRALRQRNTSIVFFSPWCEWPLMNRASLQASSWDFVGFADPGDPERLGFTVTMR
jgi:hypothetical protein